MLLFDKPLSNLDAKLRVTMRTEIRRIQQVAGITAIYVTHDQSEAMALSDQIIIMDKGVVAQIGTPQEVYYHPANEFAADFIGEATFLRGRLSDKTADTGVVTEEGHKDQALKIAIAAFSDFLLVHELQIYLVVFDRTAYRLSEQLFSHVASYIDEHFVDSCERITYGAARPIQEARRRRKCFPWLSVRLHQKCPWRTC